MSQLFTSGSQNIGDSASASVLLKSKDSQESSPALQFKGINSSALFLLHCLALTTVPDYWKDHAVVHSLSRVQLFATPWTAACQASLSSISRSLLKFMSFELVMLSNHFLCPWEFPGRNTGVGCQFSSRGSSRSRNRIHICIACIVRRILYH